MVSFWAFFSSVCKIGFYLFCSCDDGDIRSSKRTSALDLDGPLDVWTMEEKDVSQRAMYYVLMPFQRMNL